MPLTKKEKEEIRHHEEYLTEQKEKKAEIEKSIAEWKADEDYMAKIDEAQSKLDENGKTLNSLREKREKITKEIRSHYINDNVYPKEVNPKLLKLLEEFTGIDEVEADEFLPEKPNKRARFGDFSSWRRSHSGVFIQIANNLFSMDLKSNDEYKSLSTFIQDLTKARNELDREWRRARSKLSQLKQDLGYCDWNIESGERNIEEIKKKVERRDWKREQKKAEKDLTKKEFEKKKAFLWDIHEGRIDIGYNWREEE